MGEEWQVGEAGAVAAVQCGLCVSRAAPPARLHQHSRVGCRSLRRSAAARSWLSSLLLSLCLHCLPLLCRFLSPSILRRYLDESFPLKPFEHLNGLKCAIALNGNVPFISLSNEKSQFKPTDLIKPDFQSSQERSAVSGQSVYKYKK